MPESDYRRLSPEQILHQVEAQERLASRGKLKIFLGYASGVGKSYRMFDEGSRRKVRGEDVVIAAGQPEVPAEVKALLRGFETIPMRVDRSSPVVDVQAVLDRKPQVAIIDGLAFDNPPGARNAHRWQDVDELVKAGISVLTSINLQFVKEYQPRVEAIRGKVVRESVPQAFIKTADEIEIVDSPPEYAVTRTIKKGDIVTEPEEFSRQLSALRELALVLAAEVVDYQLEQYLRRVGIEQHYGTHERVLVCITPRSNAEVMIRRGRSQADRFRGELFVVHVEQEEMTETDRQTIEQFISIARELRAKIEVLRGDDPVRVIIDFARQHGITQIFIGHSQRRGLLNRLRANPVERLILEAEGMDVRIFPNEARQ
jgi:two-component system sensor histidine kinase KdpD